MPGESCSGGAPQTQVDRPCEARLGALSGGGTDGISILDELTGRPELSNGPFLSGDVSNVGLSTGAAGAEEGITASVENGTAACAASAATCQDMCAHSWANTVLTEGTAKLDTFLSYCLALVLVIATRVGCFMCLVSSSYLQVIFISCASRYSRVPAKQVRVPQTLETQAQGVPKASSGSSCLFALAVHRMHGIYLHVLRTLRSLTMHARSALHGPSHPKELHTADFLLPQVKKT